jgi:hypothetical protein
MHYGIARCMADVAIGAGNFIIVMRAAMPSEADVRVVAAQAHTILDANLGFLV